MTMTETNPASRNGVDTATLFATLNAVKEMPAAAQFQFRAHNRWINGTHNRSTITDFFGVGEEREHARTFVFDADHPAVLVGQDNGPTPVEFVLHALASCLTAGLANIAAARKITLTEVRSTVSGDIDLNGILGLNRRWRREVFEPAIRRLRPVIGGRDPLQAYCDVLEHKWLLSEVAGKDVGLDRAIEAYLAVGAPAPEVPTPELAAPDSEVPAPPAD